MQSDWLSGVIRRYRRIGQTVPGNTDWVKIWGFREPSENWINGTQWCGYT